MTTTKIKLELSYETATGIVKVIEEITALKPDGENEKLMYAVLIEILFTLKPKLVFHAKTYSMKLSHAQAIALNMMYQETNLNGTHFINELRMITHKIQQHYAA